MFLKRMQTILALLLVGGASMLAQEGSDPFPEVNAGNWQGNMILVGKVMLNGVALTEEAVVAAYYNDEIRGKKRPNNEGILNMKVHGGTTVPLHFKVYTGGRIIEVDQGTQFKWDDILGSTSDPYIINLPTPVTTNTSAEGWATTCLPFNAAVPEGVTVFSASKIENGARRDRPASRRRSAAPARAGSWRSWRLSLYRPQQKPLPWPCRPGARR